MSKNIQVVHISEATDSLVEVVQKLIPDISSVNQVPVTKQWLSSIINSDSTVLIAAKNKDQILGLAVLVVYHTLVNPRAILETIVVDPDSRRKGIGSKLVQSALDEARKRSVNTVRLATGKESVASNAMFQELGGELSDDYIWYDFSLSEGPQ